MADPLDPDTGMARFVEELLKGPWKVNVPSSLHKLLNAYVYQYSGFTPVDAGASGRHPRIHRGCWIPVGEDSCRCVSFFT